jgi:hypothetical protein
MAELLAQAMKQGQIERRDPARLGRALSALVAGSLLSWATFREGKARDWLARDIDTILARP